MSYPKTTVALLFLLLLTFAAQAQKVRLRSKITPNCGVSSTAKFADIYAEGNTAVMGSYDCRGAFIFDISNPDAPVLASWYNPIRSGTASTREQFLEAIIVGNRGYFGSGNGGGVYIVDLSNPYSPQLLGVVNAANAGAFNSIHEMLIFEQNGARYLIENFNGFSSKLIKVINVSNPAAPVFVRDIVPTETNWVHAMHIRGTRMYTSGWGTSTTRGRTEIYDVTSLGTQAPTLLGFIQDPSATVTSGNSMHSSWTSEDGNYLYSAREVGGSAANGPNPGDVRVYNVSNPATPMLVNRISMADLGLNAVTPHNPIVRGDKLYVSWYQAGLQLFDITDPDTLNRIGQYDTFQTAFRESDAEKLSSPAGEPWDLVCGTGGLQNNVPTGYDGLWAVYPFLGEDKVLLGDLAEGLLIVDVTKSTQSPKNLVSDFDGDKKTDVASYSANGVWQVRRSSDGAEYPLGFGAPGDVIVPGDYDGDGQTDPAIYRPEGGQWWVLGTTMGLKVYQWGVAEDIPVPADFDADGRTDLAVWRPSNGTFYIVQSTLGFKGYQWGTSGDKPFASDYDGDGKSDVAVWRPGSGTWYVIPSSSSIPAIVQWGLNGDKPLMADFTGDGRSDLAIYRPSGGLWYILNADGTLYGIYQFGVDSDITVPADYDGDAKTDIAIYRPTERTWWMLSSIDFSVSTSHFAAQGDTPTAASANPR